MFETAVARELRWRIMTELLRPCHSKRFQPRDPSSPFGDYVACKPAAVLYPDGRWLRGHTKGGEIAGLQQRLAHFQELATAHKDAREKAEMRFAELKSDAPPQLSQRVAALESAMDSLRSASQAIEGRLVATQAPDALRAEGRPH